MCSTMFLMGPMKQLARMCDKGRTVATCIYFGSMVLTLVAALKVCSLPMSDTYCSSSNLLTSDIRAFFYYACMCLCILSQCLSLFGEEKTIDTELLVAKCLVHWLTLRISELELELDLMCKSNRSLKVRTCKSNLEGHADCQMLTSFYVAVPQRDFDPSISDCPACGFVVVSILTNSCMEIHLSFSLATASQYLPLNPAISLYCRSQNLVAI